MTRSSPVRDSYTQAGSRLLLQKRKKCELVPKKTLLLLRSALLPASTALSRPNLPTMDLAHKRHVRTPFSVSPCSALQLINPRVSNPRWTSAAAAVTKLRLARGVWMRMQTVGAFVHRAHVQQWRWRGWRRYFCLDGPGAAPLMQPLFISKVTLGPCRPHPYSHPAITIVQPLSPSSPTPSLRLPSLAPVCHLTANSPHLAESKCKSSV